MHDAVNGNEWAEIASHPIPYTDLFAGAGTLLDVFLHTARLQPERISLTDGHSELTYAELARLSDALAHTLRTNGLGETGRVGLLVERTVGFGVAVLGALRAGAAYVPIDPSSPDARIAEILADAGVGTVVVNHYSDRAGLAGLQQVILPTDPVATAPLPLPPDAAPRPDSTAYVIYTSGSTGRPKGVLVSHRSVVEMLRHTLPLYELSNSDVWTLFHSGSFDFSVWELWGAWATGARCHVVPLDTARSSAALLGLLRREGVTVLNQVPTVFTHLVEAYEEEGAPALSLRYVMFGGERVNLSAVARYRALSADPAPIFVNLYGITETTVHATSRILDDTVGGALRSPIGRALPHLRIAVLDDDRQPVAAGETGEMWISGSGIADGYLGSPDLTAERFVVLDFGTGPVRHYRSGDLAMVLPNGELEYVGRNDDQVKLRGFRIELGEIESVLRQHPGVADAATVTGTSTGSSLVALLVLRAVPSPADVLKDVRNRVSTLLPAHFHPNRYMVVAALPQTASGKLDRTAATRLADVPDPSTGAAGAPSDTTTATICLRAAELLGLAEIFPDQDLRELGLDSLGTTRLLRRLYRRDGLLLHATAVLTHNTPRAISLENARLTATALSVPGEADADAPPRLTDGQVSLWLDDLIRPDRRTANVIPLAYRIDGVDKAGARRVAEALSQVVDRHDALRTAVREDRDGTPIGYPLTTAQALTALVSTEPIPPLDRDGIQDRLDELVQLVDLEQGPLLVAEVIAESSGTVLLALAVHHAAFDGHSQILLVTELQALLAGRGLPVPATYQRFVRSFPSSLPPTTTGAWGDRLHSAGEITWPGGRPAPYDEEAPLYAELDWPIPGPLLEQLSAAAARHRVTPFVLALGAFGTAVREVTGAPSFRVGVPTSNRHTSEWHDTVGYFVRMAVVPFDRETFADPVIGVATAWQEALRHTGLLLTDLTRAVGVHTGGRTALFQAQFAWQHHHTPTTITGPALHPLPAMPLTPQYDLTAEIWPPPTPATPATARFGHDENLVIPTTARHLRDAFVSALKRHSTF